MAGKTLPSHPSANASSPGIDERALISVRRSVVRVKPFNFWLYSA